MIGCREVMGILNMRGATIEVKATIGVNIAWSVGSCWWKSTSSSSTSSRYRWGIGRSWTRG